MNKMFIKKNASNVATKLNRRRLSSLYEARHIHRKTSRKNSSAVEFSTSQIDKEKQQKQILRIEESINELKKQFRGS